MPNYTHYVVQKQQDALARWQMVDGDAVHLPHPKTTCTKQWCPPAMAEFWSCSPLSLDFSGDICHWFQCLCVCFSIREPQNHVNSPLRWTLETLALWYKVSLFISDLEDVYIKVKALLPLFPKDYRQIKRAFFRSGRTTSNLTAAQEDKSYWTSCPLLVTRITRLSAPRFLRTHCNRG